MYEEIVLELTDHLRISHHGSFVLSHPNDFLTVTTKK